MTLQPPQGPLPPQMYVTPPPTSGTATAAMIMGVIGVLGGWCMFGLPCFIAVLLGHAAMKETKTGARGGHGMAVAGLILGYPFAVMWAILGITGIGGAIFS